MYPVYRYIDPCYHQSLAQREPNSYTCQYNPSCNVIPQMKEDPSYKYPSASLYTPSPFNYHSYPGDHPYGCCHHSALPTYNDFRPPQFSHVPPPPPPPPHQQPYYYAPYPPYPHTHPAYVIPHHYSTDQPRYDYDKPQTYNNHCCGCPNHACQQMKDTCPKIQEEELQNKSEKAQDGGVTDLIRHPSYSSPLVWVPANTIKDSKEDDRRSWNGWVPLDINKFKESRQEEVSKKGSQSPFPVIWIPGNDKPEDVVKDRRDIITPPKPAEQWPSNFKIVPLKLLGNEDVPEEPKNEVLKKDPIEKETKIKMIPVKQVDEKSMVSTNIMPEETEEKVDRKKEEIEKKEEKVDKKKEETEKNKTLEKKQSSPVRSSKLPPVCLRVDPRPRKPRSNSSSRSPSPPGDKGKRSSQQNDEQSPRAKSKEDVFEKIIPVVMVKDNNLSQAEKEQKCKESVPVTSSLQKDLSNDDCLKDNGMTEGSKIGGDNNAKENVTEIDLKENMEMDKEKVECSESKEVKVMKVARKDLSEIDAAVIIQSAYRGFEVRRWRLLEKLKNISKIREQVDHIKRQIEIVEASPKELDAKRKIVIGETIMNLLLQLDTIQGLHPTVREVRKTVARELVCLQDRLDSLYSRVAKDHDSPKVENEADSSKCEVAFDSSSPDALNMESSKQDSFSDKFSTTDSLAAKEKIITDVNPSSFPNGEAADVTSTTNFSQSACKQDVGHQSTKEASQAENIITQVVNPPFENDKPNIPACGTGTLSSLSGVCEQVSEKNINQSLVAANEPASEEVILQEKENGVLESMGVENRESDSNLKRTIEGNDVEEIASNEPVDAHILVQEESCGKDGSIGAQIDSYEDISKSPTEDAVFNPVEKKPLLCLKNPDDEIVASVDVGAEKVDNGDNTFEKSTIQLLEQGNQCEDVVARDEDSCVHTANENISVSVENEDGNNLHEQLLMTPSPVDVNGRIGKSMPDVAEPAIMVDGIEETIAEKLEPLSTKTEDEFKSDNEMKLCNDDVKDATNEVVSALDVEQHLHAAIDNVAPEVTSKVGEDVNQTNVMIKEGVQLIEENEKLRKMIGDLLQAGKEQLDVITNLNGRVKDLERKLAKKKTVKVKRNKQVKSNICEVSC